MSERRFLVLRFDAPLMSFGGITVDEWGVTEQFPGLSLLTGLLGNAIGYSHKDAAELSSLQNRICYGARRDRLGEQLVDYQTVDLSQPFLDMGWTSFGVPERRKGGTASKGTHIRNRYFLADCVVTVVLTLESGESSAPDLDAVVDALCEPERPLFLGRKSCLPSTRIFVQELKAESVFQALEAAPLSDRADKGALLAWWPYEDESTEGTARQITVTDERDWFNQIHTGRRIIWEGVVNTAG